jgi:hypothetical protein
MIAERGRLAWQATTGYCQRFLVETAMDRYEALIGPRLRARGFAAQQTKAAAAVAVLSVRRQLGIAQQLGVWGHLAQDLASAPKPWKCLQLLGCIAG